MFRKCLRFECGIGATILAILALIITFQVVDGLKLILNGQVPNIQDTLNQLAPLKVENGTVVEPVNTYKEAYFRPFGKNNGDKGFKIVIDTRVDAIDLNQISNDNPSIQLAKKNLYFVKKNEITKMDLNNFTFDLKPDDYQEQIKSGIEHYSKFVGIVIFAFALLYYIFISAIFAVFSFIFTIGQEFKPKNFAARMRVSSLAIFIVSMIDLLINISEQYYILAILLLLLFFVRFAFVPQWKKLQQEA